MRRRTRAQLPEAHINITSLLDITFVLLIAFMVVAPVLRYNVDLELPRVGESRSKEKQKTVSIQVKKGTGAGTARVHVNGVETPMANVASTIKKNPGFQAGEAVSLEADREVPWQEIAALINELKNNDIQKVAIVTEQAR